MEGGGLTVNLRSEKILSNRVLDINWFKRIEHPTKISTGVSLKYSAYFVLGLDVINIQIPMNSVNPQNSSAGNFILWFVSTIIT